MEVKDLIKLIPDEHRPKGRSTITGLASGIHFDGTTGQTTLVTEGSTYEKDFPDFPTLNYALTVYASIRSLYDKDQAGFGFAINAYIKTLTKWYKNDGLQSSISIHSSLFHGTLQKAPSVSRPKGVDRYRYTIVRYTHPCELNRH